MQNLREIFGNDVMYVGTSDAHTLSSVLFSILYDNE